MRVIVIGGSGHIGTYLVPRLVAAGHEVISISRGEREPYRPDGAWRLVQRLRSDRDKEEKSGTFGRQIAELKPDVVVDLICFTLESARHLVEALRDKVQHFLRCGTIWVHGPSVVVPTLPNLGLETVHHVHADDVACSFYQAMINRSAAIGESFHVVSSAALTLRGYAESVAGWFGRKATLRFLPWEEWKKTTSDENAQATWDHIAVSPSSNIIRGIRHSKR